MSHDGQRDPHDSVWATLAFEVGFWGLILLAGWLFSTGLEATLAFAGAVAIVVIAVAFRLWRFMGRSAG